MFIAALFTVAKIQKHPKCSSTDEWIKKMYMYLMEYYSAIKENEILPFVMTWVNPEDNMLSDINQAQKDKCGMISYVEHENVELVEAECGTVVPGIRGWEWS